jgi:prevent-host-death family protein
MIQKVTAMSVRQNLGELLNSVQYRHDSVLITKAGKPVAALVDIELFEKIRLMREQFEHLSVELAQAYQDVDKKVAEAEIAEALQEARRDK